MLSLVLVASAAFTPAPSPLRSTVAVGPMRSATPAMTLDLRRSALLQAAAVAATTLPSAAHASLKTDIAAAMGPAADAAPVIGTVVFLGIYAFQSGVFSGEPDAPSLADALAPGGLNKMKEGPQATEPAEADEEPPAAAP